MTHELYELASKATYIEDLSRGISIGIKSDDIPQTLVDEMYRKLQEVADTLDEYYNWGDDE